MKRVIFKKTPHSLQQNELEVEPLQGKKKTSLNSMVYNNYEAKYCTKYIFSSFSNKTKSIFFFLITFFFIFILWRIFSIVYFPVRWKNPNYESLILDEAYLKHLQHNFQPIPKIIHLSYYTTNIWNATDPLYVYGIQNLRKLNPEWIIDFSLDEDVENYLKEKLSMLDYNLIKNRHIVEKTDLWRNLKMYHEGGLYMDIDRFYNVPLREIIKNETRMLLGMWRKRSWSQDFMCTSKTNPLFKLAIQNNLLFRRNCIHSLYATGVGSYFLSVSQTLFNQPLRLGQEEKTMDKMLNEIETKGVPYGIYVKVESPYSTFVFDPTRMAHGWINPTKDKYHEDQNKKTTGGRWTDLKDNWGEWIQFGYCLRQSIFSL